MIDTKLRDKSQPVFDVLARIAVKLKITPNFITFVAFIFGIVTAIFVAVDMQIIAIVFLWFSGLLDVLDGSVARLTNNSSKQGAYFDLIFDRLVEVMIIIGFAILIPNNYMAYIVFLGTVIFNFSTFTIAGALIKNEGKKSMHYDVGIAERTETFIVFTLMLLFNSYSYIILMVFNVVVFTTAIIRFSKVANILKNE